MNNVRLFFWTAGIMFLFGALSFGYTRVLESSGNDPQAVLQQYRFQKHAGQDFERLVLQFDDKNAKNHKVSTSFPLDGTNTTVVQVANLPVNKNIPVNFMDGFDKKKAKYVTKVSFNADETNSFTANVGLQNSDVVVDAFWLENPSRLVIDAFPRTSPRAAGPAILGKAAEKADHQATAKADREIASEDKNVAFAESVKEEVKRVMTKTRDAWNSKEKYKKDFFCFPASAEVTASLDYKTKASDKPAAEGQFPSAKANDYVVCYPKVATVNPRVEFFPVYSDAKMVDTTSAATDLRSPSSQGQTVESIPLMSNLSNLDVMNFSRPSSQRED